MTTSTTGDQLKVGVNFPITQPALDACLRINSTISTMTDGLISFGPSGTSSPHVTVAMGTIFRNDLDRVVNALGRAVTKLDGAVVMRFGTPYRESLTGRYIMVDVDLGTSNTRWRNQTRDLLTPLFVEAARTSDEAHLTLGLVESKYEAVVLALDSAPAIPSCAVDRLHVSLSGRKGVKSAVLAEVPI